MVLLQCHLNMGNGHFFSLKQAKATQTDEVYIGSGDYLAEVLVSTKIDSNLINGCSISYR
jgi:hypothetical protein